MIKTDIAQYTPAWWSGKNESGYTPISDAVLVMIDTVLEVRESGISIPQESKERQDMAAETGIIVALGEGAFVWTADRRRPLTGRKPVPGERVFMERYAGRIIYGDDGKTYRLVTDRQVGAVKEVTGG